MTMLWLTFNGFGSDPAKIYEMSLQAGMLGFADQDRRWKKAHIFPLFVRGERALQNSPLRHSREITRVCSRRVTHRPNGARDDNALPICGLRAKMRCLGWATLSEHKWSSFGERRAPGASDTVSSTCKGASHSSASHRVCTLCQVALGNPWCHFPLIILSSVSRYVFPRSEPRSRKSRQIAPRRCGSGAIDGRCG